MIILYILAGFLIIALSRDIEEIIDLFAEWIKAAITIQIVKCNTTINKYNESMEKVQTQAIGFVMPSEEELDYYDE